MLLLLLALVFASCTGTRKLPPGDKLYTGAAVTIKSKAGGKVNGGKAFETDLERTIRPVPNKKFLFIFRPRLAIYTALDSLEKKKGFRHWLKRTVGEAPVLLSHTDPAETADLIRSKLSNEGFFDVKVDHKIHVKDRTASIEYTATSDDPYVINKVTFPEGSWELHKKVAEASEKTLLRKGMRYDLDLLKRERFRIDSVMKQAGFFYFSPEYLLFKVDSSAGGVRRVDIKVEVKLTIPHEATVPYVIQDIFIYPNYSLSRDSVPPQADTLLIDGYRYIVPDSMFRPKAILRAIAMEPGKVYSRADHDFTLSRLTELGVFKFVNLQFDEISVSDTGRLACHIYLIPTFKRSMRLELQALTKSNNFAGPVLTTSYRDRNLFKGAELFELRLNTSYEAQFRKKTRSYNAYEVGIDAQLYFPRFISPVRIKRESRLYMPRTQVLLGVGKVSRVELFSVNSFKLIGGYTWQESETKRHELNPVSINYLQLTQTTTKFQELLESNLQLQQSYREQFTIGGTYSYIYNTQAKGVSHSNDLFFNGNIDLSGNTIALIEKLSGIAIKDYTGAPYSQYAKFETDLRYYRSITEHSRLATRAFAGVGIPYGNSETLPFIKQYFSGGPNSVRAFSARSLGPGSYDPDPDSVNIFVGRAGDIRIEGNIEYRFPIVGLLKGAVFLDAGNTWLMRKSSSVPGGHFEPGKFMQDIAVGAGAGLRIDATFFVLRFDVATPLKSPYGSSTHEGNGVNNMSNIGNNLVLNVALGYPF